MPPRLSGEPLGGKLNAPTPPPVQLGRRRRLQSCCVTRLGNEARPGPSVPHPRPRGKVAPARAAFSQDPRVRGLDAPRRDTHRIWGWDLRGPRGVSTDDLKLFLPLTECSTPIPELLKRHKETGERAPRWKFVSRPVGVCKGTGTHAPTLQINRGAVRALAKGAILPTVSHILGEIANVANGEDLPSHSPFPQLCLHFVNTELSASLIFHFLFLSLFFVCLFLFFKVNTKE